MKVLKIIFLSVFSMILLTSCFKDDVRIMPYDRGEKITKVAPMTQNYKYQIYVNLDQQEIVSTNRKADFDLLFENDIDGHRILLNTASFMKVAATGKYDMSEVTSFAGLDFRFDPSSGNMDSLAIGNWFTVNGSDTTYHREVYVVDRGFDEFGNVLGKKKIVFDSLVHDTYYFTFANLNGTDEVSASAVKMSESNFIYYSFQNGGEQTYSEPPKTTYDLLFTQYTTLLFTNDGIPYPYLVTGVFINHFNTLVARDSITAFDSIGLNEALLMQYSDQLDVIGFNWKDVLGDVESGNVFYEVKPEYIYIIRTQQDMYFKLRFVNFYATEGDEAGEKGYPTFEFQRL